MVKTISCEAMAFSASISGMRWLAVVMVYFM